METLFDLNTTRMSHGFLHLDDSRINDLDYLLEKEFLLTNEAGAFSSSSLASCNTRKYHGLLVVPQNQLSADRFSMLNAVEETLVIDGEPLRLATFRYPGTYQPAGWELLRHMYLNPVLTWIYENDRVRIRKEMVLVQHEQRLLIRYVFERLPHNLNFQLRPFLNFRNYHHLTKQNDAVLHQYDVIENGVAYRMYETFDHLNMQCSEPMRFNWAPTWYTDVEYLNEQARGYDFREDLWMPGAFEMEVYTGKEIIFSAGLTSISSQVLTQLFENEAARTPYVGNMRESLTHAANQLITVNNGRTEVIAGWHWFGSWGRDTFIALPGLTLPQQRYEAFEAVLDTMVGSMKDGIFPNIAAGDATIYNSIDAPLWFVWAVQQLAIETDNYVHAYGKYGQAVKEVLNAYRRGTSFNIHMMENGLIWGGADGKALTWMDAVVHDGPVTQRKGAPVEIQALWFNAVKFAIDGCHATHDYEYLNEIHDLPARIEASFRAEFWTEERGYLADVVDGEFIDWSLRPNQVIACSLPYSALDQHMRERLLDVVGKYLYTPRGMRTLSPEDARYVGHYEGNQETRDRSYHQGTVWPWLWGHYAEGLLRTYGVSTKEAVWTMVHAFEGTLMEAGMGTISEIYDAEAPFTARGTISQAWSVSEVLRVIHLLERKY